MAEIFYETSILWESVSLKKTGRTGVPGTPSRDLGQQKNPFGQRK